MKYFTRLFLLVVLLIAGLNPVKAQAVIDSYLQQALSSNPANLQVIVTFWGDGAPGADQVNLLKQAGIQSGLTFQSLPIAGVIATPAQINQLAASSLVRSLYLNRQLSYYNHNSRALTGIDRLRSDPNITSKNHGMPVSGKGIGVLINDSGIDGTHADLQYGSHLVQNVLGSTNLYAYSDLLPVTYVENVPNTDNNSGHGTHCAGIVGGTGVKSNGKYEGAAPGADLIGYGSGAALFVLDGVGGFDYALTHQYQYKIRVITNSWGSSGSFDPNDPVNVASKRAYDHGIVVLFAAGNSGPVDNTNSPYAAPWVITVAAGNKYGELADFSSRGVKGQKSTFTIDGQSWTYENRPTITAPGVDIISTRVIAPVSSLGAPSDTAIEPAYLPYYTTMSGTSMATPHAAGIVALMLEANASLTPAQVKDIVQKTATNMPSHESWEVGAGYINAYAAVDYSMRSAPYGSTLNIYRTFNSNTNMQITSTPFSVDYNPVPALSATQNQYNFSVTAGQTSLEARVLADGLLGQTGNTINLVLISPNGTEYSSGIYVVFPVYMDRSVVVVNPISGQWTLEVRGLKGAAENPTSGTALPQTVNGTVKLTKALGYTGLNDISGDPAESSIKLAVSERLVDGYSDGTYKPSNLLKRIELADYLMMGQAIRQYLPTDGSTSFSDVSSSKKLLVESVTATGAALRDRFQIYNGVMQATGNRQFSPNDGVMRYSIAYSLVQALGYQVQAVSLNGSNVTVEYNGNRIPIDDQKDIPSGYEGYVQVALDLNLINAYFSLVQGPFDLQPVIHAKFSPKKQITRGEFAVIITRTHNQWISDALGKGIQNETSVSLKPAEYSLEQNYPNPFNPSTRISFTIPDNGLVTLEVYNSLGEKVRTLINEAKPAGSYSISFDASRMPSGIYIYRLQSGNFTKTMKMSLLK